MWVSKFLLQVSPGSFSGVSTWVSRFPPGFPSGCPGFLQVSQVSPSKVLLGCCRGHDIFLKMAEILHIRVHNIQSIV